LIAAPTLPEETVETLRASFRSRPRIVEAWVLGNRIVPLDGSAPYEAVFIGLALDPPLDDESRQAQREDFVALTAQLDSETGFGREPDRGWQIADGTEIEAHPEHALKIYP
jgi:hypothetical protein